MWFVQVLLSSGRSCCSTATERQSPSPSAGPPSDLTSEWIWIEVNGKRQIIPFESYNELPFSRDCAGAVLHKSMWFFNNKLQLSWLSNDNIKWQTSHVLLLEQFQQRQERILSAASDEGTGLVWHFWNTEPTIKLCVAWLRLCCYSLGSQCQSEMCVCLTCRLFTIITDKLVQLKNIWMLFLVQLSKDHRFAINTQSNQWTWATDRPIHTNRIENKNM